MSQSHKKVILRYQNGEVVPGYLPLSSFVRLEASSGKLPVFQVFDLLDLEGRTLSIPLDTIKLISFVRDFNRDEDNPERLTRTAFLSRPKSKGLWLRITFLAGDSIEGLAPHDLSLLDGLLEDAGIFLTPPDDRTNSHRIFIPRAAMASLEILAVINPTARRRDAHPRKPSPAAQPSLFNS